MASAVQPVKYANARAVQALGQTVFHAPIDHRNIVGDFILIEDFGEIAAGGQRRAQRVLRNRS